MWLKFVTDLQQVDGFLQVLKCHRLNKADRNDCTEILLSATLNTFEPQS